MEFLNFDLYNNLRDAILIADTERRIIHGNHAFCKLFGYSVEEIHGRKTYIIYNDKREYEEMGSLVKKNMDNREFVHVINYRKKNGEIFPGETSVFYLKEDNGKINGVVGLIRDISEKKKLENEVRISEEKFEKIYNNINDAVFLRKFSDKILDQSFIEINRTAISMLGYSIEEFRKLNPGKISTVSGKKAESIFNHMKKEGNVLFESELICKDGNRIPVEINSTYFDLDQNPVILSVARNIEERKQFEKTLKKSEQRYKSIFEYALDAIIIIDANGEIKSWNKSAEKMFGYALNEVINKDLSMIIPPRYLVDHMAALKRLRESEKKKKLLGKTVEFTALRRNGKEFPVELSLSSWNIDNEKFYTGIIRDITEKKKNEEKIKNWSIELEHQIQKRTKELKEKNEQLERMNKLFVGREFRIKELKDKINNLKEKLQWKNKK